MTHPVWLQIREVLEAELTERHAPGDRLPSEVSLAARFDVNRHTVRRAIADLQDAGLVHVRRGAGVFVTGTPVAYRLGKRTRLAQNLAEVGRTGGRKVLRLETVTATPAEAEALRLAPGSRVHVVESVGMSEGLPFAWSHGVFPADRLAAFPDGLRATGSITAALAACGVADYRRLSTHLAAERATGEAARHLLLPEGAPVLRALALNADLEGHPVEWGRTCFCTDRVELVVDDESFR